MRALFIIVALAGCTKSASKPPSPLDGIELPDVMGTGFQPAAVHEPIVTANKTGIAFNGKPVVALANGAVGAADKTDGATGLKIHKLSTVLAGPAESAPPAGVQTFRADASRPPLQLAIDKQLTYGLLIEVLYSAKQVEAGYKSFEVLARAGSRVVQVPITLPDKSHAGADDLMKQIERLETGAPPTEPPPDDPPLRMFVSIVKGELLLWSASQLEGTLQAPKLIVKLADADALDRLTKALAEIVARRWAGKERPADSNTIVLQADPATPMQLIADVLGAVREDRDRKPLFPDVNFSLGFE